MKRTLLLLTVLAFVAGCRKDDPSPANPDPQANPLAGMKVHRFAMYDSNYIHSGYTVVNGILRDTVWASNHAVLSRVDTIYQDTTTSPTYLLYKGDTLKWSDFSSYYQFNGRAVNSSPNSSQSFVRMSGDTLLINHLIHQMQQQRQYADVWGLKVN